MTWEDVLASAEAVFVDWYRWDQDELDPAHEDKLLKLAHLAYAHSRFAEQMGRCSSPEEVIHDIGALMVTAFEIGRASVVPGPPIDRRQGWLKRVERLWK